MAARSDLAFGCTRLRERCVAGHGDVRMQLVVERFDACEMRLCELDRGKLAAADQRGRLAQGEVVQIVRHAVPWMMGEQPIIAAVRKLSQRRGARRSYC